ncbi:disA bacterial checkpoint controller nucleotide-binding domain-containing protein [Ditylenchus destructor]|nr:disA bacterial checkpoint controller nucleotide-binding domain-containing protein [Ditylenchus destructor]
MPATKCNAPDGQSQNRPVISDSFSFDFMDTVFRLADQKIGATVIINPQLNPDSESMLRDMASDGTPLNEPYSSLRLYDIFGNKNSPLSNGAVVINLFPEPTIYSAGNKLHMDSQCNWKKVATKSAKDAYHLIKLDILCREHLFGNRQWSAYSVSRHIDAFVVTASEERGLVSLFKNGEVDIGVTKMRMMARITSAYKAEAAKQDKGSPDKGSIDKGSPDKGSPAIDKGSPVTKDPQTKDPHGRRIPIIPS